ncbi:hypothetical protein ACJMK2_029811 [Sinanodonta woodiana]|uniref:Methylosome protein 50 n=1 Tax=Sinanodonta woodiana TaxID=1069815 RepID=A0ABD3XFC8_SINWO
MMDQVPAAMDKHFDVVQCHADGGILLGASNLTGRYWYGSLWYYATPEVAPDVEKCTAGVQLEAGLSDAKWVDTNKALVGLDTGGLAMWELTDNYHTFIQLHSATEHDDIVTSVCMCAGSAGHRAVSSSADRGVKIWDLETFHSLYTYKAHAGPVWSVQCHPTEPDIFLSCSQDGSIFLWDSRNPKPAKFVAKSPLVSIPTCLAWHPSSQYAFAVGSEAGQVAVKDARVAETNPVSFIPHNRPVTRLEFAKSRSDLLASVSDDCSAVVTSLNGEKACQIYKSTAHMDFVRGLSWISDDKFYTCSWDSNVFCHDVSSILNESSLTPETLKMEINGHKGDEDLTVNFMDQSVSPKKLQENNISENVE